MALNDGALLMHLFIFSFTAKVIHMATSLDLLGIVRTSHMTVSWTLLLLGMSLTVFFGCISSELFFICKNSFIYVGLKVRKAKDGS